MHEAEREAHMVAVSGLRAAGLLVSRTLAVRMGTLAVGIGKLGHGDVPACWGR